MNTIQYSPEAVGREIGETVAVTSNMSYAGLFRHLEPSVASQNYTPMVCTTTDRSVV